MTYMSSRALLHIHKHISMHVYITAPPHTCSYTPTHIHAPAPIVPIPPTHILACPPHTNLPSPHTHTHLSPTHVLTFPPHTYSPAPTHILPAPPPHILTCPHTHSHLSHTHSNLPPTQLGAGTAVPGLVAAKCGAHVTFSDREGRPHFNDVMMRSCKLNNISQEEVDVVEITWGVFSPNLLKLPPQDIVIASDCFYDSKGDRLTFQPQSLARRFADDIVLGVGPGCTLP